MTPIHILCVLITAFNLIFSFTLLIRELRKREVADTLMGCRDDYES